MAIAQQQVDNSTSHGETKDTQNDEEDLVGAEVSEAEVSDAAAE